MCGEADETDEQFKELKLNFTVKGGGRDKIRQGSIAAQIESIKKYFGV